MNKKFTIGLFFLTIFLPIKSTAQISELIFTLGNKKATCKGYIQKNILFNDSEYIGSEFTIQFDSNKFTYGALDICTIKKVKDSLFITKYDNLPYISIENEFSWIPLYKDVYFYQQQKLVHKRIYNKNLKNIERCNINKLIVEFENKYIYKKNKNLSDVSTDIAKLFLIALNSKKHKQYLLNFHTFLSLDGENLETLNEYKKLYNDFLSNRQS